MNISAQAAQAVPRVQVHNSLFNLVPNPFYSPDYASRERRMRSAGRRLSSSINWSGHSRSTASLCSQQVPIGFDTYNSLMVTWTHRFSYGLQVLASYNRSKWLDDVTGNAAWSWGASNQEFRDNTNIAMNKSVDASDVPNSLVVSYIYQLPIGRGQALGVEMPRVGRCRASAAGS